MWSLGMRTLEVGICAYCNRIVVYLEALVPNPFLGYRVGAPYKAQFLRHHARKQKEGLAARSFKEGLFYANYLSRGVIKGKADKAASLNKFSD